MSLRDPLEFAADDDRDLQGIATWEPRSLLDVFLVRYLSVTVRALVVMLGLLIFAGVLVLLTFQVVTNPNSLVFVVLFPISVLPALALTGYVWYTDITREPVWLLVVTYLLGIVLASFPYLINTVTGVVLSPLLNLPVVGFFVQAAQFYFVVAPVEEVAKLAAVVAFVYWRPEFDTVVDGAVYGAIAGLGFATIENISYIIQTTATAESLPALLVTSGLITSVRSIAGPGHVIWTAIAGYFLGLAKFNRQYALPLVLKGLLVASILHGTYNTMTSAVSGGLNSFGLGIVGLPVLFGIILVYHGVFFGYLLRNLRRYRHAYAVASPGDHAADVSRLDGYEQMVGRKGDFESGEGDPDASPTETISVDEEPAASTAETAAGDDRDEPRRTDTDGEE
jgi:RsiW-degrading membrane proteinase PrsW (M82 family)